MIMKILSFGYDNGASTMLRKSLIILTAFGLLTVLSKAISAKAVLRLPIMSRSDTPPVITIDKYIHIDYTPKTIQLHEKGDHRGKHDYWEGFTILTVKNNFPAKLQARIEPYHPNIALGWDCLLDGDTKGFDDSAVSNLSLDPFHKGLEIKLRVCCWGVNPAKRPSAPTPQRVATVYVTLSEG